MKRKLTPAQEALRDARKARFAGLVQKVGEMSDAQRAELCAKMGTVVNCDGHPLSLRNTILIAFQGHPGATIVGGFRQWIKAGRVVRKGEHGATILFPRTFGEKAEEGPREGEAPTDAPKVRFLTGTVFDISQTETLDNAGQESPEESAPHQTTCLGVFPEHECTCNNSAVSAPLALEGSR